MGPVANALVTGGARRVGAAIARELAARGARLAIHYHRSEPAARALAAELGGVAVCADQTDAAQVERALGEAWDALGSLDLVVANAATFRRTPLDGLSEADFDEQVGVNLKGPFLWCLAAGRRMKARGAGCLVNVSCASTRRPWADHVPYAAAKAGVEGMTLALARALAPAVRVNAVAPGPVLLPEGSDGAQAARAAAATLLGRVGRPEDVARAVAFLAESPYITGQVLAVDGGMGIR
ncbi:MAG: SDR family oxidoreductase [Planctomycetes bacterium]|nr:SDR family oxidoreductase [Planctomycetota bacterium]